MVEDYKMTHDTPCHDTISEINSNEYLEKVYKMATIEKKAWERYSLSEKFLEIFQLRYTMCWNGKDAVYDAWLLCQEKTRDVFPYEVFHAKYPDFKIRLKYWAEIAENMEAENISDVDYDDHRENLEEVLRNDIDIVRERRSTGSLVISSGSESEIE